MFDDVGISLGGMHIGPANYHLKEGVTRQYASAQIAEYLRGKPNARETNMFREVVPIDYTLHARDFWALVLAELNGKDMMFQALETSPHEQEIASLLARLGL